MQKKLFVSFLCAFLCGSTGLAFAAMAADSSAPKSGMESSTVVKENTTEKAGKTTTEKSVKKAKKKTTKKGGKTTTEVAKTTEETAKITTDSKK